MIHVLLVRNDFVGIAVGVISPNVPIEVKDSLPHLFWINGVFESSKGSFTTWSFVDLFIVLTNPVTFLSTSICSVGVGVGVGDVDLSVNFIVVLIFLIDSLSVSSCSGDGGAVNIFFDHIVEEPFIDWSINFAGFFPGYIYLVVVFTKDNSIVAANESPVTIKLGFIVSPWLLSIDFSIAEVDRCCFSDRDDIGDINDEFSDCL